MDIKILSYDLYEARHPVNGPGWFTSMTAAVLWCLADPIRV